MQLVPKEKKILQDIGISLREYYNLFGGLSFIKQEKLKPWFKLNAPEGIVVKMSNKKKEPNNIVIVYIFHKNKIELFTDGFFLPKRLQAKGIRRLCFEAQILVAKKIGLSILTSKCTRSDDGLEFGYLVGPKIGYNGLHNSKKLHLLIKKYCKDNKLTYKEKKKLLSANDLLDLCSTQYGIKCRKDIGWTFDAEFDLKNGSKSMKVFYKK